MPELSQEAVHKFWSEYEDPMIYRVIAFMEGVEEWTLDGDPDLENAMTSLGKELDDIAKITISHEDDFIKIGAYLKMGRTLRLLQCIDTVHPGSASKMLIHAEEVTQREDDPPGLFLRRNIVFERLRLLARVFSADRMAMIMKALEEDEYE